MIDRTAAQADNRRFSESSTAMGLRHFIDLSDRTAEDLRLMLEHALALKEARQHGKHHPLLQHKTLAMIFETHSTRTRISFEVAMLELGGQVVALSGSELQLKRGESIADTAKVMSRYVDAILIRCHSHEKLQELAQHATIPVINGLTEYSHPCQVLADIMTFEENLGNIAGKTIAWVGDGNNMAQSWIQAAALLGFTLRLACPPKLQPLPEVIDWAKKRGGKVAVSESTEAAVRGADAVVTDTWVSMCDDGSGDAQMKLLQAYQVNAELMKKAAPHAIFLHCLPAHRGQEVTAEVIDGPQSRVFDEAENRLHAQKAILLWCLGKI